MTFQVNTKYGAQALDINQLADAFGGTGVLSGCDASVGTNAMEIDVASGTARVAGTNHSISATTIALDAADADNPRKDLVVVDDTGSVTKITGTPESATPAGSTRRNTRKPRPDDTSGSDVAVIAEVWVGAGASDITASDISGRRLVPDLLVDVTDDGTPVTSNVTAIDAGTDLEAVDNGDGTATLNVTASGGYTNVASGQTTLSSGSDTIDTGIGTGNTATFMLALGPATDDAEIAGDIRADSGTGTYMIDIEETDTSVGNPTVNYDVLRVR